MRRATKLTREERLLLSQRVKFKMKVIVDDDGGLEMEDEMTAERDKTKMPQTMTFIPHRMKNRCASIQSEKIP